MSNRSLASDPRIGSGQLIERVRVTADKQNRDHLASGKHSQADRSILWDLPVGSRAESSKSEGNEDIEGHSHQAQKIRRQHKSDKAQ